MYCHLKVNLKKSIGIILSVFLVLFFLGSYGLCAKAFVRKLNAQGTVELKGLSSSVASRSALEEAQKNAIMQIVGQHLKPEKIESNLEIIETNILKKYADYIRNYRIIDEKRDGKNLTVTIHVDVWIQPIIRDLQKHELLVIEKDENAKKEIEIVILTTDPYKKVVEFRNVLQKELESIEYLYTSGLSKNQITLTLALRSNRTIQEVQEFLENRSQVGHVLKINRVSDERLDVRF